MKAYDKLLFVGGLLILVLGVGVSFMLGGDQAAQGEIAASGEDFKPMEVPKVSTKNTDWEAVWPPKRPYNPRKKLWTFGVFTPPKIYYKDSNELFRAVGDVTGQVPFGLKLSQIKRPEFRLHYRGYSGTLGRDRGGRQDETNARIKVENTEIFGDEALAKIRFKGKPEKLPSGWDAEVLDFRRVKENTVIKDGTGSGTLVHTMEVKDKRTGKTITLVEGRTFKVPGKAIIQLSTSSPHKVRDLPAIELKLQNDNAKTMTLQEEGPIDAQFDSDPEIRLDPTRWPSSFDKYRINVGNDVYFLLEIDFDNEELKVKKVSPLAEEPQTETLSASISGADTEAGDAGSDTTPSTPTSSSEDDPPMGFPGFP